MLKQSEYSLTLRCAKFFSMEKFWKRVKIYQWPRCASGSSKIQDKVCQAFP